MTAHLTLDRVSKRFGTEIAAAGISLSVTSGEFIAIVGPSGSGKSTLLRLIAGLEIADSGRITLNGIDITSQPPHRRDCALVFQHYALFPHRTIRENIGFGLKMRGVSRQDAARRVDDRIGQVGLAGQGDKHPHQLSGGQQQRVALARALAVEPAVLLLDEPFGALDLTLRRQLQAELRAIQRRDGRTMIHVTHDQSEALALADRVVVVRGGRIAQVGTPETVYARPASQFVAEFMDFRNLIPVSVLPSGPDEIRVELAHRPLTLSRPQGEIHDRPVAAIRPEHVSLSTDGAVDAHTWEAIVRDVTFAGSSYLHTVMLPDGTPVEVHAPVAFPAGSVVAAGLAPEHVVLLDP